MANEAAVAAFLRGRIGFYDITDIVERCMAEGPFMADPDMDDIFRTNDETLEIAGEMIDRLSGRLN